MNANLISSVYDAQKQFYNPKSERHTEEKRSAYKNIAKINQNTPIYLTDTSSKSKESLINIKNSSITFLDILGNDEDTSLDKKVAQSSDEEVISASLLKGASEQDAKEYDIEVKQLASQQTNLGKFLKNERTRLPSDVYSFNIDIDSNKYELQYNVNEKETNLDVQSRIARIINSAKMGLEAEVEKDNLGNSALKIKSKEFGVPKTSQTGTRFQITNKEEGKMNSVEYLGLDNISEEPKNAMIAINGEISREAYNNRFSINKTYDITLNKESNGQTVHIGLASNNESAIKNVEKLVDGYNDFINEIKQSASQYGSKKVLSETKFITSNYSYDLSEYGIEYEDDVLKIDKPKLVKTIGERGEIGKIKDFSERLTEKLKSISIDPVEYVDKKIAAYKNPNNTNRTMDVYTTNKYGGMFVSVQC